MTNKKQELLKTLDTLSKENKYEEMKDMSFKFIQQWYANKKVINYLKIAINSTKDTSPKTEEEIQKVLENLKEVSYSSDKKDVRVLVLMYIKQWYRDERILKYLNKSNISEYIRITLITIIIAVFLFVLFV